MNRYATPPAPETVGELRRRLAELGNPWTVDPDLADTDPLPEYPRGGQAGADVPEEFRTAAVDPGPDLRDRLELEPPANPFLRARWAAEGLLDPADVEPMRNGEGGQP
jgi:hypothetical protein